MSLHTPYINAYIRYFGFFKKTHSVRIFAEEILIFCRSFIYLKWFKKSFSQVVIVGGERKLLVLDNYTQCFSLLNFLSIFECEQPKYGCVGTRGVKWSVFFIKCDFYTLVCKSSNSILGFSNLKVTLVSIKVHACE